MTDTDQQQPAPLTPAELAAIRARERKAMPGPWEWNIDDDASDGEFLLTSEHPERIAAGDLVQPDGDRWVATAWKVDIDLLPEENDGETRGRVFSIVLNRADAAFIAAARTDVPRLLATVDAARQRADALVTALEAIDRKLDVARLGLDRNGPQHARIAEARAMARAALAGPREGEEQEQA